MGAESAVTEAFTDDPASLGVPRKLGYRPDGVERLEIRGQAAVVQRLRMSRDDWRPPGPVAVDGLAPCRQLFGVK